MADEVFYLVYVSAATDLFTEERLLDLLEVARRKNERLGVTGMLLYSEGSFIQVLEGEEQVVRDVFRVIASDGRHTLVLKLVEGHAAARNFPSWSMGYRRMSREEVASRIGMTRFMERDFELSEFKQDPSVPHKLLLSFREQN